MGWLTDPASSRLLATARVCAVVAVAPCAAALVEGPRIVGIVGLLGCGVLWWGAREDPSPPGGRG